MDAFDESNNEAAPREPSSIFGWLALAVGFLALGLGLTGVFLGNSSKRDLDVLKEELSSAPDPVAQIESDLKELSDRLERLGSEFVKLNRQDRAIQENTQDAFTSVTRDIKDNRDGLNELTMKFSELSDRLETRQGDEAGRLTEPNTSATSPDSVVVNGEHGEVYQVQSGDTLSRIAKSFNISLNDLMEANPTVNPRSLQIGQEIRIPAP